MPAARTIAFALGALCGLALAAHLTSEAEAQAAAVKIANFTFAPSSVTVKARQPVTFTNEDGSPHSVVVTGKPFKTPTLEKGKSARLVIGEPGSYSYVCGFHPSMTGTIVVEK